MPTYSALTTLAGRDAARALGEAMEKLTPEPTGVGVLATVGVTGTSSSPSLEGLL